VSQSGPEGRSLIEAGRKAFQPTPADRERVLQALRARIPAEGGALGGPTAAAATAKGTAWLVTSAAAVGFAVTAAVLWPRPAGQAPRSPGSAPSSSAVETGHAAPSPGNTLPEAAGAAASATAMASGRSAARSSPHPSSDRLAEEVAILSRAESERHARRFASALAVLEEHRRKFPRGSLTQERMAARIRVLCGLGRVREAEAELATLKRVSPRSLHLPANTACAAK
jgi:hypothetical protein